MDARSHDARCGRCRADIQFEAATVGIAIELEPLDRGSRNDKHIVHGEGLKPDQASLILFVT